MNFPLIQWMRIKDVKTFLVSGSWRNWLIVKLENDSGLHGVGEATLEGKSKTVEAAVHELARYLVGKDPFAIDGTFRKCTTGGSTRAVKS